ncbi:uncharacterized protein LTR77_003309 [Saxophila tyrrhenica]|uniref:Chromo domain-containing protein n=1 Tax=Saxophila tyrrhenica TaxID=1690608 RepID=A0AAV9PHM6_9PEZI|nr:hypothetical protein LTR77_003309 [Saxophila tyrrhenica]
MPPKRSSEMRQDRQFYVERIRNTRFVNGQEEFLIRWRGYGPSEDQWVAREDVDETMVQQFLTQGAAGMTQSPGGAGPSTRRSSSWRGWKEVDAEQEDARLEQARRNNGFGLPVPESRDALSTTGRGARLRSATPQDSPAPSAVASPSTTRKPSGKKVKLRTSSSPAKDSNRGDDSSMPDAASQAEDAMAVDEDVMDVDEEPEVQSPPPKAKGKPKVPFTGKSTFNNMEEGDDAPACTDLYSVTNLSVTEHCKEVRECQAAGHTGPVVKTCNECYNATLASITAEQQAAFDNGAFATLCNPCVSWSRRNCPKCNCLEKMYCCSCLVKLADALIAAKAEADYDNSDVPTECQLCTNVRDGTETVQYCYLCGGTRILEV